MDTSPEYINMCRKATELQEKWEPEPGDFYKLPGHFITCIVLKNSLIDVNATWLPRIDQLVSTHKEWLNSVCDKQWTDIMIYSALFSDKNNGIFTDYITPEQRALQGMYLRQYHKYWNGEDWI